MLSHENFSITYRFLLRPQSPSEFLLFDQVVYFFNQLASISWSHQEDQSAHLELFRSAHQHQWQPPRNRPRRPQGTRGRVALSEHEGLTKTSVLLRMDGISSGRCSPMNSILAPGNCLAISSSSCRYGPSPMMVKADVPF